MTPNPSFNLTPSGRLRQPPAKVNSNVALNAFTLRAQRLGCPARWRVSATSARLRFMPYAPSAHTDAETRTWVRENLLPSGGVTVAEENGTVVGVMACSQGEAYRWINQMSVSPALVGQGIGTQLLQHALRTLPTPIRLYTFQANLGARRFYERHKFRALQLTDGQANEEHTPMFFTSASSASELRANLSVKPTRSGLRPPRAAYLIRWASYTMPHHNARSAS